MGENVPNLEPLVHDLRNCLFVIETSLRVLKDVREDEPQFLRVCDMVQREGRQAAQLVAELMEAVREE